MGITSILRLCTRGYVASTRGNSSLSPLQYSSVSRTDPCHTCNLSVAELALIMTAEEMVERMTSQVQGDLFCDMEGAWWNVSACQVREPTVAIAISSRTVDNLD